MGLLPLAVLDVQTWIVQVFMLKASWILSMSFVVMKSILAK